MERQGRECLLIWVRHGERADNFHFKNFINQFYEPTVIEFKFDPPLTPDGKTQAFEAGVRITQLIKDQDFEDRPLKILVSPFLRTLQTASYISKGMDLRDRTIYTNNHLAVKLKPSMKKSALDHGAFATKPRDEFLRTYTDTHIENILPDELS